MTQDFPPRLISRAGCGRSCAGAGLPEPDCVEEHDHEVHFLWDEQKVVLIIEADGKPSSGARMIVVDLPILEG